MEIPQASLLESQKENTIFNSCSKSNSLRRKKLLIKGDETNTTVIKDETSCVATKSTNLMFKFSKKSTTKLGGILLECFDLCSLWSKCHGNRVLPLFNYDEKSVGTSSAGSTMASESEDDSIQLMDGENDSVSSEHTPLRTGGSSLETFNTIKIVDSEDLSFSYSSFSDSDDDNDDMPLNPLSLNSSQYQLIDAKKDIDDEEILETSSTLSFDPQDFLEDDVVSECEGRKRLGTIDEIVE